MGGMMGWGSSYMGRMASMGGMMGYSYGQINISGVFLVGRDVEDMEHMAILIDASGRQYALILPAEEWILVAPNGSKTVIDLEDLRSALNSTRVTITGINIGSMAEMHSMMGMMWGMMGSQQMCHSPQGSASTPPMPGMGMGGMMGHHMGGMGMGMGSPPHSGEGEEHKEHDHMEACARLMALPHIVVRSISFNGYTAIPSS